MKKSRNPNASIKKDLSILTGTSECPIKDTSWGELETLIAERLTENTSCGLKASNRIEGQLVTLVLREVIDRFNRICNTPIDFSREIAEGYITNSERKDYEEFLKARYGKSIGKYVFEYRSEIIVRLWIDEPNRMFNAYLNTIPWFNANNRIVMKEFSTHEKLLIKILGESLFNLTKVTYHILSCSKLTASKKYYEMMTAHYFWLLEDCGLRFRIYSYLKMCWRRLKNSLN